MGALRLGWTAAAAIMSAVSAGAAELPRNRPFAGEVRPDPAWLTRQGLAPSYAVQFTIDGSGHAAGAMKDVVREEAHDESAQGHRNQPRAERI